MLPVGVVIPTKNSMRYLPAHVGAMRPWISNVVEIVVVDSYSNDGTVEFLRRELKHPNIRFKSHPPGLYASWNAGIGELNSQFTYISTVGDTMTREGLVNMVDSILRIDAEVIISPPTFFREGGASASGPRWPVHEMISDMRLTKPTLLPRLVPVVYSLAHPESALLGSCAGNIFRTETLRRLPFPTEVGVVGDGVWGWRHAAEVRWAVFPNPCSTFLIHPTAASVEDQQRSRDGFRADQIISSRLPAWIASNAVQEQAWQAGGLPDLLDEAGRYAQAKVEFDLFRRAWFPWRLSPRAWAVRRRRNQFRKHLREHARLVIERLVGQRVVGENS